MLEPPCMGGECLLLLLHKWCKLASLPLALLGGVSIQGMYITKRGTGLIGIQRDLIDLTLKTLQLGRVLREVASHQEIATGAIAEGETMTPLSMAKKDLLKFLQGQGMKMIVVV